MRRAELLALSLGLSLAFAAATCDDDRKPVSIPPPAPIDSLARAAGFDAASVEPSVDPAAPSGDLQADIDAFASIDGCVAAHAHVDPLVGDALEAIGYDTLFRDSCRILDAAKARDARRCEAIDSSALQMRCQATVAQVAGDADACPWTVPTKPAWGRDGACVAIASRDARLCAGAADRVARATCEAIIGHDSGRPCAGLSSHAEQARCKRVAERWRAAIPAVDHAAAVPPPPLAAAEGTLRVDGTDAAPPLVSDLAPELARGVVLVDQRDGWRVVVGALSDDGPGFIAPSPYARPAIAIELLVPPNGKAGKVARIERAELQSPGRPPLATPGVQSTLVAKIEAIEPTRGGAVKFSLDGVMGDARVRVQAVTFVRDIVKAAALYGARVRGVDWPPLPQAAGPGRLGVDGGMR